ncbi:orc1/cdc6 family replication initiation protein, partial [Candidatus Woesearchaeota archaeon]|nr:orc1/cdc6 family replication initiation protein [Candidatus Woesearchaeota archaeon]
MSEVWYKKLGFDNNPFSIKPAIFNEEVVECEELLDDISLGVLNGNIIFVQGDYGEGKTTLLKRLLGDFGGKKKVIYFSCNRIENELNVKKLLNKRYGFIGKLFDIRPKNMILLLDEAHALSQTDYDKLYQHYADGHFKSIVLVSKEYDKKVFNSKLRSLVKHYRLKTMTEDGAAKLVRDRIGDLPIITDEITKVVYKLSNKNVRTLLQNCEELCKIAAGKGMPTVTEELVFQLFNKDVEQAVQK